MVTSRQLICWTQIQRVRSSASGEPVLPLELSGAKLPQLLAMLPCHHRGRTGSDTKLRWTCFVDEGGNLRPSTVLCSGVSAAAESGLRSRKGRPVAPYSD